MKHSWVTRGLVIILSVISAILLSSTAIHAATFGNEFITNATITNGPSFSYSSHVNVRYDWAAPADGHVSSGDQLKIQLPDELRVSSAETFPLTADDGTVLGTVVVSTDGSMVVTFNETAANLNNLQGTITFSTKLNAAVVVPGEQSVAFDTNSGVLTSPINVSPSVNNLSKKGSFTTDAQGNPAIKWTILVNRNELIMANVKVADTITDPQQQLVPSSITTSTDHWTDSVTQASYKRDQTLTVNSDYGLTQSFDSFQLTFAKLDSQMIVIDYLTTFKDPTLASDGSTIFKNTATMTWGTGGSGSNSEKATASVKQNSGSGTGNGDQNESSEDSSSESSSNSSSDSSNSVNSNSDSNVTNSSSSNADSSAVSDADENLTGNSENSDSSQLVSNGSSTIDSSNQSTSVKRQPVTDARTETSHHQADTATTSLPKTGQRISVSLIIVGVMILGGLIVYLLRQH